MSHLPAVGRRALSVRSYIIFVFVMLSLLGVTMVVPFLITVSSSTTNDYDYDRFRPVPRYFWSSPDRYMKGLVQYFNLYRSWNNQMQAQFRDMPKSWTSWLAMGDNVRLSDRFAEAHLQAFRENEEKQRKMAADYSDFELEYPIIDTVSSLTNFDAIDYLSAHYRAQYQLAHPEEKLSSKELRKAALGLLSERWGIPLDTFYSVTMDTERNYPLDLQSFYPPIDNPKYQDFEQMKLASRAHFFTPGVRSKWLAYLKEKNISYQLEAEVFPVTENATPEVQALWREFRARVAPASPNLPYAMRAVWYRFLGSEKALALAGLPPETNFGVEEYNRLAGTAYQRLEDTPFPLPEGFRPEIVKLWEAFLTEYYPLRLVSLRDPAAVTGAYQKFLETTFKHLRIANELLGTDCKNWNEFKVTAGVPTDQGELANNQRGVWLNFVQQLPLSERVIHSSEIAYQEFLLKKYGSLERINQEYGWNLQHLEEAFPPFAEAYTVTFVENERAFTLEPIFSNYRTVLDFLWMNANAIPVTLILITLAVALTLTVNPLAAYALSRFNMRQRDQIILFMLATMAFPAMVSAIPAYLLMRDLGLLNTFFALVLPTAANGMSIFILKGFFDSLPQELFEAATIDGASEFQIFCVVAMPLVKPILAINSLNAFIAAYNGWEWALIICQKESMWTISVWLYQANIWWAKFPWVVSAGFVVASIPTLLVFLGCQKIILRGIIIPSMK